MTIPDEAVQAAHAEYHKVLGDSNLSNPMLAALTAALPFLTGVKVKALEWTVADNFMRAVTPFGSYVIHFGEPIFWTGPGVDLDNSIMEDGQHRANTIEAAKSAAQADYEARIRPAIELAPTPRAQALEELPCDVQLPGVILKRGVKFSVFLAALKRRESWPEADRALSSQPVADGCKTEREQALEKALKPFSDIAGELFAMNYNESDVVFTVHRKTPKGSKISTSMTFKAFNNARAALPASPGASE